MHLQLLTDIPIPDRSCALAIQAAEAVLAGRGLTLSRCAQALRAPNPPRKSTATINAACRAAQAVLDERGHADVSAVLQLVYYTSP